MYFFTYMYFKKIQTMLLEQRYQIASKIFQKKYTFLYLKYNKDYNFYVLLYYVKIY